MYVMFLCSKNAGRVLNTCNTSALLKKFNTIVYKICLFLRHMSFLHCGSRARLCPSYTRWDSHIDLVNKRLIFPNMVAYCKYGALPISL